MDRCLHACGSSLLPNLESRILANAEGNGLETVNLANLASRYAINSPEMLTRLIARVGPTTHALLVDALSKVPNSTSALEGALKQVDHALRDHWAPSNTGVDWWNDLDRSLAPLTPEAIDQLLRQRWQQTACTVTEHFMLMLQLSREELTKIEIELKESGFRVAAISPYLLKSQPRAMVLWKRDGRASEWAWPLSAEQLEELNEQHRERGDFTADLSEVASADYGDTSFACVWTDSPPLSVVEETVSTSMSRRRNMKSLAGAPSSIKALCRGSVFKTVTQWPRILYFAALEIEPLDTDA